MKKVKVISFLIVFAGIFLLSTSYDQPEQPQGKFYYGFDTKIFLAEVPNKFVVSFINP